MKDIILPEDRRAASKSVIEVWVSRNGNIFTGPTAEKLARYDGATHVRCNKCGCEVEKPLTLCDNCKFEIVKKEEYDDQVVCIDDKILFDSDELIDYLIDICIDFCKNNNIVLDKSNISNFLKRLPIYKCEAEKPPAYCVDYFIDDYLDMSDYIYTYENDVVDRIDELKDKLDPIVEQLNKCLRDNLPDVYKATNIGIVLSQWVFDEVISGIEDYLELENQK